MHKKVMIVGTVPYNKQMSSRAFNSYFNKWEKENLAQVFSNPRKPVRGHCNFFYQITDKRMLKRLFNSNVNTGQVFLDKDLDNEWNIQCESIKKKLIDKIYGLGSIKFPLNHLIRGIIWKKEHWCTEMFNDWIDKFNPECVFLAFSDDFFILDIALYISEKFDIPIISCIGDDYYFNDRRSISPFYYLYRKKYKKLVNLIFEHGGSAAYIGDKIRDKYNETFGIDGRTVYLTSEIERHPYRRVNTKNPFISYCGNIRLGRNTSLCDIATTLRKINDGYKINVYSNETESKYYKLLEKHTNINFCGSIPYKKVMEVMSSSDILLIVEGFKKKDVDVTRYSLSTKVADSLAVGSSILTYGSLECGAVEYMKSINCGPVCYNKEALENSLKKILFDEMYQKNNYNNAIVVSNKNHTIENSNYIFEKLVNETVKKYKKRKAIK